MVIYNIIYFQMFKHKAKEQIKTRLFVLVIGSAGLLAVTLLFVSRSFFVEPQSALTAPMHAISREETTLEQISQSAINRSSTPKFQFKRINFSTDAASVRVTDTEGQNVVPDSGRECQEDANNHRCFGNQSYSNVKNSLIGMMITGRKPGKYHFEIITGKKGIDVDNIKTETGIVDMIRHDENSVSITFDKRRRKEGTFQYYGVDYTRGYKTFLLQKLPVIPGATITFTIDWKALQEDQAALTISVDREGEGQTERSLKVRGQLDKRETEQTLILTPETPEYAELFGTETASQEKD